MNLPSWLFLAALVWLVGFLSVRITPTSLPGRKVIRAPMWLFILCGKPHFDSMPFGVMPLGVLFVHAYAFALATYGVVVHLALSSSFLAWPIVGIPISILVAILVTWFAATVWATRL